MKKESGDRGNIEGGASSLRVGGCNVRGVMVLWLRWERLGRQGGAVNWEAGVWAIFQSGTQHFRVGGRSGSTERGSTKPEHQAGGDVMGDIKEKAATFCIWVVF